MRQPVPANRDVGVVAKMPRERAFEAAKLVGSIGRRRQASRQLLQPCKVRGGVHVPPCRAPRPSKGRVTHGQQRLRCKKPKPSRVRGDSRVPRGSPGEPPEGRDAAFQDPRHYATATRPRSWQRHSSQPPVELVVTFRTLARSKQATDHPRHRSEGACLKPSQRSKRARPRPQRGHWRDQRRRLHWGSRLSWVRHSSLRRCCRCSFSAPYGLSARRRAMAPKWSIPRHNPRSHGQRIRGCALTTQVRTGDRPF